MQLPGRCYRVHVFDPAAALPPQDLSPKYASALLGITNTFGALPGILGVASAGYLLDVTNNWALALFYPTAACQLFGAVVYTALCSAERFNFDAA